MKFIAPTLVILLATLVVLFFLGRYQTKKIETVQRASHPFSSESSFLETRSGRVHYLDKGEGNVLILLHGTGYNIASWQDGISDLLAENYRVIAFDYYGHGLSDRNHGFQYGQELWAEQAIDMMDELSIEKATFIGHSIGGMVVSRIAVRFPERTERIVLMGTGIAMDPLQYGPVIPGLGEFLMSRTPTFSPSFSDYQASALEKSYEISGTRSSLLIYLRRQYTIDGLRLLYGTFENFKIPALHIHGTKDISIPWSAGQALAKRTGGEFQLVEGVGHYAHIEDPETISRYIKDFVSSSI
jgi:pimeloyl-ACP methyl ester carboxylesterase